MSDVEELIETRIGTPPIDRTIDTKLEVVAIPVADIERAKAFYGGLGWRLDGEFVTGDHFHAVQFTPPGSPASIHFGKGVTPSAPGSAQGLFLIVADIEAARTQLNARGAEVSEIFHVAGPGHPPESGRDPAGRSYFTYAAFKDPDGNGWLLQEVVTRLPGRVEGATTYNSRADLAAALRRAEAAHGDFEKTLGHRDEEWPEWYAAHMIGEQTGG